MASHTDHITTPPTGSPPSPVTSTPPPSRSPELTLPPGPSGTRGRSSRAPLFWGLLGLGVLLNVGVIYLGYQLFSVAPPKEDTGKPPLKVPYSGAKSVLDEWRNWALLDEGRIKPFGTFCEESLRFITGRVKFEKNDPVAVVLSWLLTSETINGRSDPSGTLKASKSLGMQEDWESYPFILCDYHDLRRIIHKDRWSSKAEEKEIQEHGKYISPEVLRNSPGFQELVTEVRQLRSKDEKAQLSMVQSKAHEVNQRLGLFDRIRNLSAFGAVPLDEVGSWWFPFGQITFLAGHKDSKAASNRWAHWLEEERQKQPEMYRGKKAQEYPEESIKKSAAAYEAVKTAYQSGDEAKFAAGTTQFLQDIDAVSKKHKEKYPLTSTIGLELQFNRSVPFQKAWIFCLLGGIVLSLFALVHARFSTLGSVLYYLGMASFIVGLGWALYGFYCRVVVSGRPPVSNMYETIIFVAAMVGVFGLVLELIYRRGYIVLAASLVSALGFILADQLPNTFSPNIQPLTAVLRSQYWLIVHVMTIVSSYAAFALAWGLGNLNIGLIVFRPEQKDLIKTLSHYSYKAIQVGVILLFFGTMLGGWWAAESWGRFWGWDAKEVWALIAFIAYIIPLHARYVGWVKDFGLAACSVVCFAFVVGAWYGVNFIFPAGLHSYGFGAGNNRWVYFIGLINISLVVHAGLRYISRGGHLASAD